nr:TIGR02679 family protein [Pseudorhodoferax sp. Leaf267]
MFRHVSVEKAALYRAVMDVFAAAKRQFRLHLRPDEVLAEGQWPTPAPRIEEIQAALSQLSEWGNLQSQPDTARVASLGDFYRARFLYRLSQGGEAVEAALATFARTLRRRAELQTVALEDIANRLQALRTLADEPAPDAAKVHETLRDLVRVFESLSLRQLLRAPPAWVVSGMQVFVCENPNLLAIATDQLGARCAPLVCTDGMPAAAQRSLLTQLAQAGALLRYHGDFDWPGIHIANHVLRSWPAQPWRMGVVDYAAAVESARREERELSDASVPARWDDDLSPAMQRCGLAIAEEAVTVDLLQDLELR